MGRAGTDLRQSDGQRIASGVRAWLLLPAAALVLAMGSGCQNKLHDENLALRKQNRELQEQADQRNANQPNNVQLTAPPPVTPPPPMPAPVEPRVRRPAPPPEPVIPAPTPSDLGGEVTVDPVAGTTTVNFVGDALFDSGKAVLKDSSKKNLDKTVSALKGQYSGKPVKVQGHTDSDPIKHSKWKDNMDLSRARANAVRDYLVQKGIAADVVTAEGMGDTQPKSSDPKQKALNRRVEIVVMTR